MQRRIWKTFAAAAIIAGCAIACKQAACQDTIDRLLYGAEAELMNERFDGARATELVDEWATSDDGAISLRLRAMPVEDGDRAKVKLIAELRNNTQSDVGVLLPFRDLNRVVGRWLCARRSDGRVLHSALAISCGTMGREAFITLHSRAVVKNELLLSGAFVGADELDAYEVQFNYSPTANDQRLGSRYRFQNVWSGEIAYRPLTIRVP